MNSKEKANESENARKFSIYFKSIQLPTMNSNGYNRLRLDGTGCTQDIYSKSISNISELHPEEQLNLLNQYEFLRETIAWVHAKSATITP